MQKTENKQDLVEKMFEVGAHYGYSKTRRHPSVSEYIYSTKNRTDIINLEKTEELLNKVQKFVEDLGAKDKVILFVGTKPEAKHVTQRIAEEYGMPFVNERWIGGLLTNFPEIKKRIAKLEEHHKEKNSGDLNKYTKKERMLIAKKMERLERFYSGVSFLKKMPDAIIVIDPKHEKTAVKEAKDMHIPIIAIANSDCNIKEIQYPVVANDATIPSITFFLNNILSSYKAKILSNK